MSWWRRILGHQPPARSAGQGTPRSWPSRDDGGAAVVAAVIATVVAAELAHGDDMGGHGFSDGGTSTGAQ